MKKVTLFLTLAIISLSASAQLGISFGARAGLNIPKLSASGDNPMSKGYESRLAGNAGIFAEFHFNDLFSIQPMIEYTQQGGKRNGMQAIPARMLPPELLQQGGQLGLDYLYADFKSETKFNYLMIPVLAKFGWKLGQDSPFRVHVSAGPYISFLLSARQVTHGNSYIYVDPAGDMTLDYLLTSLAGAEPIGSRDMTIDREIKGEMNSINYGVSANGGLSYEINPKNSLIFEVGGNYGFRVLQKDSQNGENRIGAVTVTLGYAYRFR